MPTTYVEANLVPGETVAHRARLHWIVVAPVLLLGSALDVIGIGTIVFAVLKSGPGGGPSIPLVALGAVLSMAGSALMAIAIVKWRATEITVTTRRVLIKTGVLHRHTTEILLSKVESISIDETMLGRTLGFGMVTVHGTGGTPERFDRIAHPHAFRRQVQIQIEALSRAGVR